MKGNLKVRNFSFILVLLVLLGATEVVYARLLTPTSAEAGL